MGAEHTNPDKLKQIVDYIIEGRNISHCNNQEVRNVCTWINDEYGLDVSPADVAPYVNQRYIVEEKYDGYSYINDEGRFFSKRLSQAKGNENTPIEKTGHMPYLAYILKQAYDICGCDLHGEIYVPGGISDDVTKILGCTEDEAVFRTNVIIGKYGLCKTLHYRLIDIRKFHGKDITSEPYFVRRILLEYVYNNYIQPYSNGLIDLTEVLSGDPRDEFRRIVNSGGEGIIMKRTSALYIPGKKPADNWVKGKKKITLDVVITGFNDGTGKNRSLFGSFEFGLYIDGKLTKCGNCSSGLSDSIRQQVAADPNKYIGTVMEIDAMQESVKSFRNAVFIRLRDDKDATECTPMGIMVNDKLIK